MTDEPAAAGAPSAVEAVPATPMSLDDAVSRLNAQDAAETPAADSAPAPEADPEPDAAAADEAPDQEPDGEPSEDDAQYEFDKVHGNTKFRFRDGTVMTKAEIAKRVGELKDFERQKQEFEPRLNEFQAKQTQIAQQAQFFQTAAQQAIALASQYLPNPPDKALLQTDPIEYMLQKETYEAKVGEIRQLDAARQAHQSQVEQQRQVQMQDYLKGEQAKLIAKMPELQKPEKAKEFYSDLLKHGRETYGFSDQELGNVLDHRTLAMARDAIAYRKLMAAKPVVQEKARDAVPVQQPQRRPSSNEQANKAVGDRVAALRRTGRASVDDVAAILNMMD